VGIVIEFNNGYDPSRRSPRSFGEKVICHACESHEYWEIRGKVDAANKFHITAMVCTSDECDRETILEVKDGIII